LYRTATIIDLPTGEGDLVKLLQKSQQEHVRYKSSTIPTVAFYATKFLGWYAAPIARFLIRKLNVIPTGLTSFPGGLEYFSLLQYKAIEFFCFVGMVEDHLGKYEYMEA